MQPVEKESRPPLPPPSPAPQILTWYVLGVITAVAIGGLAATLHLAGVAPVGILPLGVGLALGAILTGLATVTRVTCRKRLIVGVILLALLAVIAEHAWLYRDFRRQWHEARAKSPHVAMFRPETPWSPAEYFAHEISPGRVALWCVDAALVTAASVGTVLASRRLLQ